MSGKTTILLIAAKKFLKLGLMIFNIVFWLVGIILLALGVYMMAFYEADTVIDTFTDYDPSSDLYEYRIAGALIVAVGVLILLTGILGCVGAWKENVCLLTTYGILLVLILILQIAAGVYLYVFQTNLKTYLQDGLDLIVTEYDTDDSSDTYDAEFDKLQELFQCCGANGSSDWGDMNKDIPVSCCEEEVTTCTTADAYTDGCVDAIYDKIYAFSYIAWVAIGFCVIEILGVLFAIFLVCAVRASPL